MTAIEQALQVWSFEDAPIRTLTGDDGEPRWVAADVCRAIGINSPERAYQRLDDDEREMRSTHDTSGRTQEMMVVNESGLYTLILGSRQERAKRFKRWVTGEVLPSIRKTGRYEIDQTPDYDINDPDSVILAKLLKTRTEVLAIQRAQEAQWEEIKRTELVALQAVERADTAIQVAKATEESVYNVSGYVTALGYARREGLSVPLAHLAVIGRKATALCASRNTKVQQIHDPRFGMVNCYPTTILQELHEEFVNRSDNQ